MSRNHPEGSRDAAVSIGAGQQTDQVARKWLGRGLPQGSAAVPADRSPANRTSQYQTPLIHTNFADPRRTLKNCWRRKGRPAGRPFQSDVSSLSVNDDPGAREEGSRADQEDPKRQQRRWAPITRR